jgi:hypothetical protein
MAKLQELIDVGVKMLCAAEAKERSRPYGADARVRNAFLDQAHDVSALDRLAAKQAIAAALRRHVRSTKWAEKPDEQDQEALGLARAFAVAYALDDQRPPGWASHDATRDRDMALRGLWQRIRRDGALQEKIIKCCDEKEEFRRAVVPVLKNAATVLRQVARLVWKPVPALIATVARTAHGETSNATGEPQVLDPDPWWVPNAQPEKLSAEARATLLASLLTVYSTQFGSTHRCSGKSRRSALPPRHFC